MKNKFYGWWITAATFITFGLAVGLPYYNLGFFYDYYTKDPSKFGFNWSRPDVVLGFPLAALFTIWVGPVFIHRFSPRKLILAGTFLTFLAFTGFAHMGGSLYAYYALFGLYTVGYIFSGPIAHQVIVSHWFRKRRGFAMGIVYVGVGVFGAAGSYMVKQVTAMSGGDYRVALQTLGFCVLLAWPLALFVLKDKPSEIGQFPDGAQSAPAENKIEPHPFSFLLKSWPFWLLTIGSFCSIASIGAVNFHMKFVFRDQGFNEKTLGQGWQGTLDSTWALANVLILVSSIAGRLFVGGAADKFPKKIVMVITYLLVCLPIPIMLLVTPSSETYVYLFSILFGFGMGADYMLIPLMAAEQFGVNTLARAMAIILPVNTIGQTWFPYAIARLQQYAGSYAVAMAAVFTLSLLGTVAIGLLPRHKPENETLQVQGTERAAARS